MSKKIANMILKNNEFKYYRNGIYLGKYENYDITIKYDRASMLFNILFSIKGKKNIEPLNDILEKKNKFAVAKYKEPTLTISIACDSIKDMPHIFNSLIDLIIKYLKENKYKNICPKCLKNNETFLVDIDSNISYCCDDCYNNITNKYHIESNRKKQIKENIPLGIFGAILGCIPGMIVWAILVYLIINPSIVGLLIMLGATYGYMWGAKAMKIPGLIITIIIGMLAIFICNEFTISYALYNEYINQYNINIIDAYKAMPYYLKNISTFKETYNQSLFISILFGLFGALTTVGVHRRYLADNKIKKLEVK